MNKGASWTTEWSTNGAIGLTGKTQTDQAKSKRTKQTDQAKSKQTKQTVYGDVLHEQQGFFEDKKKSPFVISAL